MSRVVAVGALAGMLAATMVSAAQAPQSQGRPYIGYAYPAGGQQGTTFAVKLGGQGLDGVNAVQVSGRGVTAKVVEYFRKLSPQDMQLLGEQIRELRRTVKGPVAALTSAGAGSSDAMMMMSGGTAGAGSAPAGNDPNQQLMARIQRRMVEYVQRPACASLSSLVFIEVTVAKDAPPGQRELTLATPRGVSNPLVFHVGQLPETTRKPMLTAQFQVLGKEELALRTRPDDEIEKRISVPCTMNGQVASGEVNRYRFEARKGQRLVISALARQLMPYIADAVPGWFQPVMVLQDASGKEMAYDDDYRFKPDPVILFQVPKDGEYVLSITDAIYRGREDFVYRVTIGELPFVTSIFPLGGRVGEPVAIAAKGWNLPSATVMPPAKEAGAGIHSVAARQGGVVSNRLPFALDTLPECLDKEPNGDSQHAQQVKLPSIVNGRIDRPGDWDVFQFSGRAGQTVVAEVLARRLDSPLDSVLKLTDSSGKLLAFNDDHEDPEAGVNTHDADSYLTCKLPADGTYYVHLADTARSGGEEYAYRLRISQPRPDFALRIVPSTVSLRSKGYASLNVHVLRKDGFDGPIKLGLKDPPAGFSASSATLSGTQTVARLSIKTDLVETKQPVVLRVEGVATIGQREVAHQAVAAEDRMQAFLWRHLVPAQELKALVYDPSVEISSRRLRKSATTPPAPAKTAVASADPKSKFTKQQVAGRLRQIKLLFEEGLITEDFNHRKVQECEAQQ